MHLFRDRKPAERQHSRDPLTALRATMANLEAEREETQRIVELKRILAARIAEIERKEAR